MVMTDQTVAGLARHTAPITDLYISESDRAVLRSLANKVAELAARPLEEQKRELWYRHNMLQPTRPVIFCDPENGWNEIITTGLLACEGRLARDWEMTLCKEVFWAEQMRDDRVVMPTFDVRHIFEETDWGMRETKIGGEHGGGGLGDVGEWHVDGGGGGLFDGVSEHVGIDLRSDCQSRRGTVLGEKCHGRQQRVVVREHGVGRI
jgi:hypothetical protein